MVPELVRQHVRLREVPWSAESILQLVEEAEIEVHLLIRRAVERPRGGLREAARRLDGVPEQHRARLAITPAEDLAPRLLGVGHHGVDELHHLRFFGRRIHRARGVGIFRRWRCAAATADQREKIDAGRPAQDEEQQEPADSEPSGPDPAHPRTAAAILDVAAVAGCPLHRPGPRCARSRPRRQAAAGARHATLEFCNSAASSLLDFDVPPLPLAESGHRQHAPREMAGQDRGPDARCLETAGGLKRRTDADRHHNL